MSSGIAYADPSADEVRDKIEKLEKDYSKLAEDYNQAKQDHDASQKKLDEVKSDRGDTQDKLDSMREDVASLASAAYSGVDYSSPSYLMGSGGPDEALEQAADLGYLSQSQQENLDRYLRQKDRLDDLSSEAKDTEKKAEEKLDDAKKAKNKAEEKLDEQQTILDDLTAEERADATSGVGNDGGGGASYTGDASGDARTAIEFAYAQIGDSYSMGANGPDVWDCSSLMQAAWQQGGVSLPRTTYSQVNAGSSVSWDQMQPGDLIFFYDGPSHVGMYVGNGKMVHASNPSKPVAEVSLSGYYQNNFHSAVRP